MIMSLKLSRAFFTNKRTRAFLLCLLLLTIQPFNLFGDTCSQMDFKATGPYCSSDCLSGCGVGSFPPHGPYLDWFLIFNNSPSLGHSNWYWSGAVRGQSAGMDGWQNNAYTNGFQLDNAPPKEFYFNLSFPTSTSALQFEFRDGGSLKFIDFYVDGANQGNLDPSGLPSASRTVTLSSTQTIAGFITLKFKNNCAKWVFSAGEPVKRGILSYIKVTSVAGFVDCGLRIKDDTGTTQTIACKENPGTTPADIADYPLRIKSSKSGSPKTYGIALVAVTTPADANATKIRVRVPGATTGTTVVKALRKL